MIMLGLILLFLVFLGIWVLLIRSEKQIKFCLKKLSGFHQNLQAHQFYLKKLFKFLNLKVPPSWVFGLPLIVGSLVFIISSWIFAAIAEDIIAKEPLTLVDAYINQWFFLRASPSLTGVMVVITDLASFTTMLMMYLFLVFILSLKRRWYDLVFLSLAVPGGMLLTHLMKVTFQRPRPLFHQFFVSPSDYSFPSGHTINATLLYGIAAIFAVQIIKEWKWQVFMILFTSLFIILVALSRVYLGYHYLSDTLGAITIGIAWLSLCFVATTALTQIKKKV